MPDTVGSRYREFRITRHQILCFVNRTNSTQNIGSLFIQITRPFFTLLKVLQSWTIASYTKTWRVSLSGRIVVNTDNETPLQLVQKVTKNWQITPRNKCNIEIAKVTLLLIYFPINFKCSRNVRLVSEHGFNSGSSDLLGDVHGLGFIRPVVCH